MRRDRIFVFLCMVFSRYRWFILGGDRSLGYVRFGFCRSLEVCFIFGNIVLVLDVLFIVYRAWWLGVWFCCSRNLYVFGDLLKRKDGYLVRR